LDESNNVDDDYDDDSELHTNVREEGNINEKIKCLFTHRKFNIFGRIKIFSISYDHQTEPLWQEGDEDGPTLSFLRLYY
jgi:hypothetical protein